MRTFILIAALSAGGFAFAGPIQSDDPQSLLDTADFGDAQVDVDSDGMVAVEVADGSTFVLPLADHGDRVTVVELAASAAGADMRLDAAGVQRTPAGRPIDAQPGSMDAAQTGMQHDVGTGTVRNTVSPEPTPSPVLQAARADDPDLGTEQAPQAQEPTES